MSNEVINQTPSIERAKELEQQAKDGLNEMQLGQEKTIIACHTMRDTKAYKILGFDSYYAWGGSALKLKKSRLNELALAGEVQQELLTGVESNIKQSESTDKDESNDVVETEPVSNDSVDSEMNDETVKTKEVTEVLVTTVAKPITSASDLSEMGTPPTACVSKST